MVKNLPAVWKIQVWSLGQEDGLEKGVGTLSSILAWRISWKTSLLGNSPRSHKVPGASVRNPTHGKGHEEGGLTYAKAGSGLRGPLDILEHLPPKPESACLTALCFHLHFWHYGGLSPTTSLWKGANLELQLINLLGVTRVFQSKNSSDGTLACLTGLSGHMWLFIASQPWEAQDAINFLNTDSFENLENY